MKRLFVLMLVFCVLALNAVAGEESEVPTPDEHLQLFEPLIGTWRTEREGSPGRFCVSAAWCIEKNAVLLRNWYEDDQGKRIDTLIGIAAWDPLTKRVVENTLRPDGKGRSEGVWEKTPNGWRLEGKNIAGTKGSGELVVTLRNGRLVAQMVKRIDDDGARLDDGPVTEFTRYAEN